MKKHGCDNVIMYNIIIIIYVILFPKKINSIHNVTIEVTFVYVY